MDINYKLQKIHKSTHKDKKLTAVFLNKDTNKTKLVHFGASGYSDYTIHKDDDRKMRYISRHQSRENWNDPLTPGALSRWVLWNKKTLKASIDDYKKRFNL